MPETNSKLNGEYKHSVSEFFVYYCRNNENFCCQVILYSIEYKHRLYKNNSNSCPSDSFVC